MGKYRTIGASQFTEPAERCLTLPDMQSHSEREKEVLESWERNRIFERSVEERPEAKRYTFYDGPPFATGLPHYGSILPSVIKDLVPRYWTMKGYRVERVWGWDCHGVPIENMIEKELDLKGGKKGIEELGIDKFNAACRAAILRFDKEWEVIIKRVARWVDFKNSYKTMDNTFMESVWWGFQQLHEKNLVREGKRVILYCPRCATPLSNFEIAMDNSYKETTGPSTVYKYPVKGQENTYLLAWSTTPWNKIATPALVVNPDLAYVKIAQGDEQFILAKSRLEMVSTALPYTILEEFTGKDLEALEFTPHYDFFPNRKAGERFGVVIADSYVTADDGTGIVTLAVYGEDDYRVMLAHNVQLVEHVDAEGKLKPEVTPWAGMFMLKVNPLVNEDLAARGLIYHDEERTHSVPVCYRCETRLYHAPVPAWFIDVQALKPQLIAENEKINWYPEHLKKGRFGKGLETAPDWNISRSRYWGTPMPVWVADDGTQRVVGSFAELKTWAVDPSQVEALTDFHREFIDPIEVWVDDAKTKKGRRIPEVFDCWVESGSMPFAAIHAPFEHKEQFESAFPAQFITEYIAQTRAWFYVMHVMSVALFGRNAYENVLTTGTILAADGQKMSKSKKNYPDPTILIEKHSADALRFYLMSQPLVNGENLNFSEAGVDEVAKKFITIMKNVVAFYGLYKEHDDGREPSNAHVLDEWIAARLAQTLETETAAIERYDLSDASRALQSFVTDLSTWYVRRSRDRVKNDGDDRAEALATLRATLITFAKMTAPFMPFLAEMIYRDVTGATESDSVHLQSWPTTASRLPSGIATTGEPTPDILETMGQARAIVSRVMEVREKTGRSVKQALGAMRIATPSGTIDARILEVILDEVNVKTATVVQGAELAVDVDTALTPALIREGMAREVTRRVNGMRKDAGLTIADRIDLVIESTSPEVHTMFEAHAETMKNDTLATSLTLGTVPEGATSVAFRVAEQEVTIGFVRV